MGFGGRIAQYLESTTEGGGLLHAVGQGALGIEVREGDEMLLNVLKAIEDTHSMMACVAERSLMRTLEGGCSVPIGVETSWVGAEGSKKLRLVSTVVSLDGTKGVDGERTEAVSTIDEADYFGKKVARDLVDKGAQKILDIINQNRSATAASAGAATTITIAVAS
jgi:hydroxymethylbilane synthase